MKANLDGGFIFFECSPGEDELILTSIFFNWVGSTTNYSSNYVTNIFFSALKRLQDVGPFKAQFKTESPDMTVAWILNMFISKPEKRKKRTHGGGFKYFLFSPLYGEMIQFD